MEVGKLRTLAKAEFRSTQLFLYGPLGTGIEHGHDAAVLRPARNIIAYRDRTLLAVGDRAHALRRDAARDQIVAHRWRAPSAERDVVFARTAFVGVALHVEGVLTVGLQPLRLLLQRRDRLRRELRGIGFEEDAIADIDHEVLLAAGRRIAGPGQAWIVGSVRACGGGQRQGEDDDELRGADDTHNIRHSGASIVASLPDMPLV